MTKPESATRLQKLIAKTTFRGLREFANGKMVVVTMAKQKLCLNRPIQVGVSILAISKVVMLSFFYRLRQDFGNAIRMCYSDTDFFILAIREDPGGHTWYSYIQQHRHDIFDTSNFPKKHPLCDSRNKKIPPFLKEEKPPKGVMGCGTIREYVGLSPKSYCNRTESEDAGTAKGLKKCIRQRLGFADYLAAHQGTKPVYHPGYFLRSTPQLGVEVQQHCKKGLAKMQSKMWLLDDGKTSVPLGHPDLLSGTPLRTLMLQEIRVNGFTQETT